MNTLQKWLDENKRLCEQATPGPWGCENGVRSWQVWAEPARMACIADVHPGVELDPIGVRNAMFISASRLTLEQALRIIEAILAAADDDGVVYRGEVEDIAWPIINEPQKGGAKGEPDVPPQTR